MVISNMSRSSGTVSKELYQEAFRHVAKLGHLPPSQRYTRRSAIRLDGSDGAYKDLEEVLELGNLKLAQINQVGLSSDINIGLIPTSKKLTAVA